MAMSGLMIFQLIFQQTPWRLFDDYSKESPPIQLEFEIKETKLTIFDYLGTWKVLIRKLDDLEKSVRLSSGVAADLVTNRFKDVQQLLDEFNEGFQTEYEPEYQRMREEIASFKSRLDIIADYLSRCKSAAFGTTTVPTFPFSAPLSVRPIVPDLPLLDTKEDKKEDINSKQLDVATLRQQNELLLEQQRSWLSKHLGNNKAKYAILATLLIVGTASLHQFSDVLESDNGVLTLEILGSVLLLAMLALLAKTSWEYWKNQTNKQQKVQSIAETMGLMQSLVSLIYQEPQALAQFWCRSCVENRGTIDHLVSVLEDLRKNHGPAIAAQFLLHLSKENTDLAVELMGELEFGNSDNGVIRGQLERLDPDHYVSLHRLSSNWLRQKLAADASGSDDRLKRLANASSMLLPTVSNLATEADIEALKAAESKSSQTKIPREAVTAFKIEWYRLSFYPYEQAHEELRCYLQPSEELENRQEALARLIVGHPDQAVSLFCIALRTDNPQEAEENFGALCSVLKELSQHTSGAYEQAVARLLLAYRRRSHGESQYLKAATFLVFWGKNSERIHECLREAGPEGLALLAEARAMFQQRVSESKSLSGNSSWLASAHMDFLPQVARAFADNKIQQSGLQKAPQRFIEVILYNLGSSPSPNLTQAQCKSLKQLFTLDDEKVSRASKISITDLAIKQLLVYHPERLGNIIAAVNTGALGFRESMFQAVIKRAIVKHPREIAPLFERNALHPCPYHQRDVEKTVEFLKNLVKTSQNLEPVAIFLFELQPRNAAEILANWGESSEGIRNALQKHDATLYQQLRARACGLFEARLDDEVRTKYSSFNWYDMIAPAHPDFLPIVAKLQKKQDTWTNFYSKSLAQMGSPGLSGSAYVTAELYCLGDTAGEGFL